MEGRNRSGGHSSSGVVKNRSSSGCLIIKNKADGVSGVGSSKKGKKRPRLNATESLSCDEEVYPKSGVAGRSASLVYKNDNFEDVCFGRNFLKREVGPKRRELDVYDFDEYDDISDAEMLRMRHSYDRGFGSGERRFMGMKNDSGLEFDSGSSKGDIIYKRRNSFRGGSSIEKIRSADLYTGKTRFEMRNELPVSMGKEKFGRSDDAIRLQGKNGVLKVRVKHKEDISEQLPQNYLPIRGNNVLQLTSKNLSKRSVAVDKLDKNRRRKPKPVSAESSEESDEEAKDSDSPLKLQTNSVQVERSTKRVRTGGSLQLAQKAQPTKLTEGKVKRGSGTEKQLLREKIRTMLIDAGWTIDYRPRRGRDYFDAVYVNPTGTAYWSIIKAYDALQKQLEEEGNTLKATDGCSSFASISEDVLSKLTRQTRKRIEKELKRKKREETGGKTKKEFDEDESDTDSGGSGRHDDKLSSFMKRSGKSLKVASKEFCRDGSNSNSKMQERGGKSSSISNRFVHARNSKKIGRCMLLVRNSGKGLDSESDGFIPYAGKRNLLSWLIDCGTVKVSEKVHYMNRRCSRVMLEGWITREGIHCACCSKILTVSKFEIHAASKLRQPYQNIYLSSGASLMQCLVDAWNRQEESLRNGFNKIDVNGDDPNDDTCAVCCDGGNLICCDSCPSTFHQNCLGIEMLPSGDWHCLHCSCKFCGVADMSVIEGNNRGQDTVLTCCSCEGKYHSSCVKEMDSTPVNSNDHPFCGKTCQELSERLQKLLGVKHELEAGLFWSLIHRTDLGSDSSVRGFQQKVEWNSKLAVARNVMDECFLPIIDRRSGINMIHNVLYNSGSNITRLDYSGFYTAILEKGDEIVSAASIRIHGTEFAEMPFIGTRHIYRRQGMCRRLFSAIELALHSLKVEKLIIPAISELMDTWITVFGFCILKESDKQGMKVGNMLVFPGIDMLQKKLSVQDSMKRGLTVANSFENGHNSSVMPGLTKKSEFDSSPEPSSAAAELENEEMKDKSFAYLGSEDMVYTDQNSQLGDSEYREDVPPLPTENEEKMDKLVSNFASGYMICTDETSLHSASANCCKEVEPCLAAIKEEVKNKSSDYSSENLIGIGGCEELKTLLPTVFEEMRDKSVFDSCSEQMIFAVPSSSADCCEEVEPSLPIDKFTESEKMQGQSFSSASADCHEEVRSSLGTASPWDSNDNNPASQAVLDDAKFLVSNGGCLALACSELQLDAKFNKSVDATDYISEDTSTGICEIENIMGNSDAKHSKGVSFDCKMMQGDEVMVAKSGALPGDGRLVKASSNVVLNGLQKSHSETQSSGILSSIDESRDDSVVEASQVIVEMEKPTIESTAEDNFDHLSEVEVDEDSHIAPAETDVWPDSQSLHISDNLSIDYAHEPKINVSRNDVVCSLIIEELPVDGATRNTTKSKQ